MSRNNSYQITGKGKEWQNIKRDILHLKSPGNWINDPNGFIYYQRKYHLFYQYNPYAPVWGTMHWGHAVSEDLVRWEHLGIALFPSIDEDKDGCFSGSALEQSGKLNLYYTGIRYSPNAQSKGTEGDKYFISSQLMIHSEDGIQFDNTSGKRVIVPVVEDEELGDKKETRDPNVWEENGQFYMVLGSTYQGETGRLLFYTSMDAVKWTYINQFRGKRLGSMLECPNIFRIGDGWVFMCSPMGMKDDAVGYTQHAICMNAWFDPGTCHLTLSENWQYVDYGMDLYAPQTNVDKDGNRVMIAWMRMPKAVEKSGECPWNGMMCIPRVIEVSDGHIYFRVHPEVGRNFSQEVEMTKRNVPISEGIPYRIKTSLEDGGSMNIGGYKIKREGNVLRTDRSMVFSDIVGHQMISSTPKLSGECRLDIFVEPNLIEVFINEGEYVISSVVYGLEDYIDGKVEKVWRFL